MKQAEGVGLRPDRKARKRVGSRFAAIALSLATMAGGLAAGAQEQADATAPTSTSTVAAPHGRTNVILNMFQWNWNSVAAECPTIGAAGVAYVQVSPPNETINDAKSNWWTSYQPVSYKIESKLGTRAEFKAMVDACGAAGVGIIADAVINHMAGTGQSGVGQGGSAYSDYNFPGVPYSSSDFNNDRCNAEVSNYKDRANVQFCRLSNLQDLKTGSDYVRGKIAGYLNDLISLGVKGFRIDAAKHIPADDLVAIKQKLTNPNIYFVNEAIGASGEAVQDTEYISSGDVHEFDYARSLKGQFDGSIANLKSLDTSYGLMNSANAGVFVDNHDTERNGETMNYKYGAKYKLANAFMLSYGYGSPSLYTGYRWTDKEAGAPGATGAKVPNASCTDGNWTCTQRDTDIKGMVWFYNYTYGTQRNNWQDNGANLIGYGRGDKGFMVINNESSAQTKTFQTSLAAGQYCDVIASGTCSKKVTVGADGKFTANVAAFSAMALLPVSICDTQGACEGVKTEPATVYYSTAKGWSTYNMHYQNANGEWTAPPGVKMEAACTGWVKATVADGPIKAIAFNNGSGTWDSNGDKNYVPGSTTVRVENGVVTNGAPSGCGGTTTTTTTPPPSSPPPPGEDLVVYAAATKGWATYNIHYQIDGGSWTTAPGPQMTAAECTGWVTYTIPGAKGKAVVAAFNSNNTVWDSNGGKNWTLTSTTGIASVNWSTVSFENPCPKPVYVTVTQTATATVTQNATQTVTQNATQTVTQNATQTVTQNATQTVTQNATQTVTQNATQTVTQKATQTVTAPGANATVTVTADGGKATVTDTVTAPAVTQTVTVAGPNPTATKTVTATATKTVAGPTETVTAPGTNTTVTKTVTPSVSPTSSPWVYVPSAPYEVPGTFTINGRQWQTTCENYSQTVRCRTNIWASPVRYINGQYVRVTGWTFNNLTYLPYMTRSQWAGNPLAFTNQWTTVADGRQYRTECDTAITGQDKCRSYVMSTVVKATKDAKGNTVFYMVKEFVLNNIVMFKPEGTDTTSPKVAVTETVLVTATQTKTNTTTATATTTVKSTSTQTATTTTTATQTTTATATATRTSQVTTTAVSTATVTVGATATATVHVTVTPTVKVTPTNVVTPTVTVTKTQTVTPTTTVTPTITVTPGSTAGPTTTPEATTPVVTPPASGSVANIGTDYSVGLDAVNPAGAVGKAGTTITIDGSASDWNQSMLIAQGAANDAPQSFLGFHEAGLDSYALYATWDDANLYVMWQLTNTFDVTSPGAYSDTNGKPYYMDLPMGLAFDITAGGGDGRMADGKSIWAHNWQFGNKNVDKILMMSTKAGVGTPGLFTVNSSNLFDYTTGVKSFTEAGVSYKYGDGNISSSVMGINKLGYPVADLADKAKYTDFMKVGHKASHDTFYEIKIPLAQLGITRAFLETTGIGVMQFNTYGESIVDSLPRDPATKDNVTVAYSEDPSTSAEKEDVDIMTARFARIGTLS